MRVDELYDVVELKLKNNELEENADVRLITCALYFWKHDPFGDYKKNNDHDVAYFAALLQNKCQQYTLTRTVEMRYTLKISAGSIEEAISHAARLDEGLPHEDCSTVYTRFSDWAVTDGPGME